MTVSKFKTKIMSLTVACLMAVTILGTMTVSVHAQGGGCYYGNEYYSEGSVVLMAGKRRTCAGGKWQRGSATLTEADDGNGSGQY